MRKVFIGHGGMGTAAILLAANVLNAIDDNPQTYSKEPEPEPEKESRQVRRARERRESK